MNTNDALEQKNGESEFRRRIRIVTWVTLLLPPVTGILMLSFVGIFPFPEVFYTFADYGAALLIVSIILGTRVSKKFVHNIIDLAQRPNELLQYKKQLTYLPVYYFSVLFVYFAIGLTSTLYSLSTLHGFNYPSSKYFISFLGVVPGGLITALPIFFYLSDTLGRYLAPVGVREIVAPIKLKLIVLGLFVPVLIDTLLIMYYYDRTGYFSLETIGIWFLLIVMAAVGTFMAWQSFRQSFSPFVMALESENGDHKNIAIVPQSLDELGLLSEQWHGLWTRVLDYEQQVSDLNRSLTNDIQQRTQELEGEKLFINKVLENTSALVIVLDRQGRILRFNPACENVTGFSFEELRDSPIWEWLIPMEQVEGVKRVFFGLTDEGLDSKYENYLKRHDGSRVLVAWNNSTIKDEYGKVRFIVSIGIDISEREAARQALQEAKEIAEKASLAKSEFLSRMSHELRTPMNAILGFAQLLKLDSDKFTDSQNAFIDEVLNGGNHLLLLINEVLDLAKIEEGKLHVEVKNTAIRDLILDSIKLLKPEADKMNINVKFQAPEDLDYVVKADDLRLKQVFINLLSNAIKYNREGGDVLINMKQPSSARVHIAVEDTGSGIALDKMDKLFIPFDRLGHEKNHSIEGTGIGLALSKRLMELMQGEILVENRPGLGCTFVLDIEFVKKEYKKQNSETRTLNESAASGQQLFQYTVLYVEDNPSNLKLVDQVLKIRKDISLISAHSGPLGLEMASNHLPDLILLDINLPGIDGNELVQILKQNSKTKHIPVIAVSANAMQKDIEEGEAAGFNEYLVKPLNVEKFLQKMDKYLPAENAQ